MLGTMDLYEQAADRLARGRYCLALTGAGISAESGIPPFRGTSGLWTRYNPAEYATIEAFRRDPEKVWRMLLEVDGIIRRAAPNPAHFALAEMEQWDVIKAVVTQNIDGLHQRAGSRRVMEYHGGARTLRCDACSLTLPRDDFPPDMTIPRCRCGQVMRPELVFFGELIPPGVLDRAQAAAAKCDVLLVVGTSAAVAPASYLPLVAKENGAFVVEINPEADNLPRGTVDLHIAERAATALPAIADIIKANLKHL